MKLKKITALVLALVTVCALLVSCSNEEGVPDGYKKISEDNIGYSLFVPELWEESGPCGAIVGAGDTSKVSLLGFDAGEATSAEECFDTYYESLAAEFGEISFIEKGTDAFLGENAAKQYVYTANVAGKEFKFLQIIYFTYNQTLLSAQPEAYIFTYTATPESYDLHIEEVIDIAGYVTFDSDEK